jgi:membrane protein DedA with SNARE-associated domain
MAKNLEEKIEDDAPVRDSIKAAALHMGSVILLPAGGVFALKYEHTDPLSVLLRAGVLIGSFLGATLLYNVGCYYLTSPSERGKYQKAHPWVPSRIVNYLSGNKA